MKTEQTKKDYQKRLLKEYKNRPSYQKMKQEYEAIIRQLTDDITTLVENKDFMKVTAVKMQWRMQLDTERIILSGSPTCRDSVAQNN